MTTNLNLQIPEFLNEHGARHLRKLVELLGDEFDEEVLYPLYMLAYLAQKPRVRSVVMGASLVAWCNECFPPDSRAALEFRAYFREVTNEQHDS